MSGSIFQLPGVNLHPNMAYTLGVSEAITKKWNMRQIAINKTPIQQRQNAQGDVTRYAFWVMMFNNLTMPPTVLNQHTLGFTLPSPLSMTWHLGGIKYWGKRSRPLRYASAQSPLTTRVVVLVAVSNMQVQGSRCRYRLRCRYNITQLYEIVPHGTATCSWMVQCPHAGNSNMQFHGTMPPWNNNMLLHGTMPPWNNNMQLHGTMPPWNSNMQLHGTVP